jgi:hypothetical protein
MTIQGLINKIFRANQTQTNTVSWSGSNGLKTIQEDIVETIRQRTFFTVPTAADLVNQGFNNAVLCYVQDQAFFRWQAQGIPNGTTIFPANDGGVWVQETVGDTDGTVTSIGITAPAAFTVTNSPVTTSGVIDIAANGTSAQYIKGDGTLGTLPTPTGGTVTNVSALTLNTSGTDLSSTVANPTTTPVITLSVPTASAVNRGVLSPADWTTFNSKQNALTFNSPLSNVSNTVSISQANGTTNGYLSSTDWTTFNSKQNTITLTTTGSSGASTFISNTINVPNYTLSGLGGVPYTGATGNVNLGANSLTLQGSQYNSTTPPAYSEGAVWYDTAQKSLAFYNDSQYSPVYIGENIVLKVYNNTGSTIAKGAAVYIQSGGSFTYPNVGLAKADNASTSAVIGLMNASTPTGSIGYVTAAGVITGVSTGSIAEGTILYLSPYSAGQLMNTIPPTGYAIQVGVVAHQNSPNGTIYIKQTTPLAISAATIVGTVAAGQGGTGSAFAFVQGGVMYGSSTSALASTAIGTSGQVLTSNGASAPTWTTPVTGTGTTNYLSKWTSSSTLNTSLIYDNGTNVGIGTASPTYKLDINGTGNFTDYVQIKNYANIYVPYGPGVDDNYLLNLNAINSSSGGGYGTGSKQWILLGNGLPKSSGIAGLNMGNFQYESGLLFATATGGYFRETMRLTNTGNLLINSTTDAGYRLDVSGDSRIKGSGSTSGTTTFRVENSSGGSAFTILGDGTVNMGFNASLTYNMSARAYGSNGGYGAVGVYLYSQNYGNAAGTAATIQYSGSPAGVTSNGLVIGGGFGLQSATYNALAVNQSYTGLGTNTLVGYLFDPTLDATFPAANIISIKTTKGNVQLATTSGNVLIGTTTDAGYKLYVNGTAYINGSLSLSNGMIFGLDGSTTRLFNSGQINYQSNSTSGIQHNFTNQVGYNTGTIVNVYSGGSTNTATTGTMQVVSINGRLAYTSGNAEYNALSISTAPENAGTYTGTIRGIYYNPSSVIGTGFTHRAIETVTGDIILGSTSGNVGIGTITPGGKLQINGSITASGAIARSTYITSTLTAAANNDVLVGLDVNPTFTNGSFTGVSNLSAKFTGNVLMGQVPSSLIAYSYVPLTLSNNAVGALKVQLALVNGGGSANAGSAIDFYTYTDAGNGNPGLRIAGIDDGNYSGNFQIITKAQGSSGSGSLSTKLQIFGGTGNVVIQNGGTFTDAGYKLDVNGTARVQGNLTAITGSWDSFGIAVNNIRRNTEATLVINSSGSVNQSLQFTATSSWGSISSGAIYGMVNNMNFAGTGTSSFINLGFTNTYSTSTSGRISVIEISGSFTTTNASSILRGFLYNPSVTLAGSHRAIETVIGDVLLGSTSGSVGIGANTSINASAILDITSTTKGFLPPRMTNAQRTAISSPAIGLIVYCTDVVEGLYIYKSTGWTFIV